MSNLKAIKRENTSSGSNNKLRSEGLIPAVLYGGKETNRNISVEKKDIKNLIHSDTFLSKVLELDIDGKKERVIPRDVAFNVCLLYTSPSPRDLSTSRMPSSA